MLARTFKSAAELGMEPHEYNALVTVLHMLEDGTIPPDRLFMPAYHKGECHCLAGWANIIDRAAFPETRTSSLGTTGRLTPQLKALFAIDSSERSIRLRHGTAEEVTAALRTFLETGVCA